MDNTKLNQFFKDNPTFDRPEWHALIRPCVDMVFVDDCCQKGSYFGGKPYLPKGFELPTAPKGNQYNFIGQINLAMIAHLALPFVLPKAGLLSLFYLEYADDWEMGDNEPFWRDDGFIKAYYFADTTDFVLHDDKDTGTPPKGVSFVAGVDLPCNSYFELDYPDDVDVFYERFYDAVDDVDEHLFGYPTNDSLGYDPTPTDDGVWLPLLTLKSHDDLNWCWHDGDRLMIFIEQSALAKGDFSNIKADAG